MLLTCLWFEVVDILVLLRVAVADLADAVEVRLLYLGSPAVDPLELPVVTSDRLAYPAECLLAIRPYL